MSTIIWFAFISFSVANSLSTFTTASSSSPIVTVINLDHDTTRWSKVSNELATKNKSKNITNRIQRLSAVHGKSLTLEYLKHNVSRIGRWFGTRGMIGCHLSHRKVWEMTADGEPSSWRIVLEDDVIVAENFCEKVEEAVKELEQHLGEKQWDVLILGAFGCVHPQGKYGVGRANALVGGGGRRPQRITDRIHIPHRPFGTYAYALSARGAKKLLDRAWYASGHLDAVIWGIRELDMYCHVPLLAFQNMNLPSTIGGVTRGFETLWLPSRIKVDPYTNVSLIWALNEPLIRVPGDFVVTIGRALGWSFGGFVIGFALRKQVPWLLPIHTILAGCFTLLVRFMSIPVGRKPLS